MKNVNLFRGVNHYLSPSPDRRVVNIMPDLVIMIFFLSMPKAVNKNLVTIHGSLTLQISLNSVVWVFCALMTYDVKLHKETMTNLSCHESWNTKQCILVAKFIMIFLWSKSPLMRTKNLKIEGRRLILSKWHRKEVESLLRLTKMWWQVGKTIS